MALSNMQYDEILREYDERQLQNKTLLDARTKEIYQKIPELLEIEHSIAEYSVASARKLLSGDSNALDNLKQRIASLRTRKTALLNEAGYPADYLAPIYHCPDCKDTGYIDGKRCHCFIQRMLDITYNQSNIKDILAYENFSNFSFKYYSNNKADANGLTPLSAAKKAYDNCQTFIKDFDHCFSNLLFYGDTGVGKTFLSNCVAKELLDTGHSVIYFTAFQLFDILSKGVFDKDKKALDIHQNIFECDLLIIDDLGTELTNSFTCSQLFLCLNERILRKKATIISTNLNMAQLGEIYSERTFSRILKNYRIIKMFGDDIRIKKRIH